MSVSVLNLGVAAVLGLLALLVMSLSGIWRTGAGLGVGSTSLAAGVVAFLLSTFTMGGCERLENEIYAAFNTEVVTRCSVANTVQTLGGSAIFAGLGSLAFGWRYQRSARYKMRQ